MGYAVQAIEPSSVMRAQAAPHPRVHWLEGVAERLPLGGASVDGVVSTLAIHHFSDLKRSLLEMDRVAGTGPIVLFTFDYSVIERPWQGDYFPSLWADMTRPLPPLSELSAWITENTPRRVEIVPFLLPSDLTDLFMLAAWSRPHLYLDPEVRAGISTFALADEGEVEAGLARLRTDLEGGRWEATYGELLKRNELDLGYRFLCATT